MQILRVHFASLVWFDSEIRKLAFDARPKGTQQQQDVRRLQAGFFGHLATAYPRAYFELISFHYFAASAVHARFRFSFCADSRSFVY